MTFASAPQFQVGAFSVIVKSSRNLRQPSFAALVSDVPSAEYNCGLVTGELPPAPLDWGAGTAIPVLLVSGHLITGMSSTTTLFIL